MLQDVQRFVVSLLPVVLEMKLLSKSPTKNHCKNEIPASAKSKYPPGDVPANVLFQRFGFLLIAQTAGLAIQMVGA